MSDFDRWIKAQLPDYNPNHDLEVIVDMAFIMQTYEAGRKAGLEEAAEIAESFDTREEICSEIVDTIREKIK